MVRLRSDQERTLEELSYLTPLLEEKRISLSLVLDPFSLSPSHPAFRFVKTVTDHGSSIAVWDGESLHLDPAQEQNQALAQWDLQKRLAAGSIADELLMPNTASGITAAVDVPLPVKPLVVSLQVPSQQNF